MALSTFEQEMQASNIAAGVDINEGEFATPTPLAAPLGSTNPATKVSTADKQKAVAAATAAGTPGTTGSSPLVVLSASDRGTSPQSLFNLKYLTDSTPYFMMLRFFEYKRAAAFENAISNSVGSIILPLPANFSESISPQINDMAFGAVGGELAQYIDRAVNSQSGVIQGMATEAKNFVNNVRDANSGTARDLRALIFRRAIGALGQEVRGTIDTIRGSVPNPHVGLVFNGVNLRQYNFSWRFSPNNSEESYNIHEILKTLKAQSLPMRSPSGFYLEYPSLVRFKFGGVPFENYGVVFKNCLIDGVNIDYAPNGTHSFFRGTSLPTDYTLTISLKETAIHVRNDYLADGSLESEYT